LAILAILAIAAVADGINIATAVVTAADTADAMIGV
jgi:hypothetical protein